MQNIAVCVLAYNEANHIRDCLRCLIRDIIDTGLEASIHVIVNGSSDNTAKIARDCLLEQPMSFVHEIDLGDKANAWNTFVHDLNVKADVFVFHDGDCQIIAGSLAAFLDAVEKNPAVMAIAAMPFNGKNVEKNRAAIRQENGLWGNLYALRGDFVERLRQRQVRIPIGWIGDDDMVNILAKWNLNPFQREEPERVYPCQEAGFCFAPLSLGSVSDLKLLFRRLVRYSLRRYQDKMLFPLMRQHGLAAIPDHVETLYSKQLQVCKIEWRGFRTLFDWLALQRMKALVRQHS